MKNNLKVTLVAAAFSTALFTAGCASTSEHDHSTHSHSSSGAKAYSLKTCLVTDEDLGDKPVSFVHQGQEVKLCCEGCKEDFDKDPATYLKKLQAAK